MKGEGRRVKEGVREKGEGGREEHEGRKMKEGEGREEGRVKEGIGFVWHYTLYSDSE